MRNTIIVALILAAACTDKPAANEGPPPDTAGGRPDLSHPEVGKTVAVVVTDTAIELSSDSIEAVGTGQISFSVSNQGTITKEFTIDGKELGKWVSTPVPPGQAILMSMLMGRGEYELSWPATEKTRKASITIY